jgi:L-alanine-DL-glutamate epimerase-like enolase superfamily enzyme
LTELATSSRVETPIESLEVAAYKIPTDAPESDGTYEWDATTLVVARVFAGGAIGLGYTYADTSTAVLIRDHLREVIMGRDAMDVASAWQAMVHSIRNLGRPGIASMAIAAVDIAIWDVKARVLQLPLSLLLGKMRDSIPAYGSGGFTSYSLERIARQLGEWSQAGMRFVKMKIGREPERDMERVRAARAAIADTTQLFVDANGAYGRKQALDFAARFSEHGVTWFEEPVSSDDLDGLRMIRDAAPSSLEIAAGEYGYDSPYFRRMLDANAVDVLQADATRCAGISGFLQVAALCKAHSVPLSAHTAPTLHSNICCSISNMRHIEYFYDHQRIEHMLFDGAAEPLRGELQPNIAEPGLGIALREADARRYAV